LHNVSRRRSGELIIGRNLLQRPDNPNALPRLSARCHPKNAFQMKALAPACAGAMHISCWGRIPHSTTMTAAFVHAAG
jgi:hypothetical protein